MPSVIASLPKNMQASFRLAFVEYLTAAGLILRCCSPSTYVTHVCMSFRYRLFNFQNWDACVLLLIELR